jgi:hypothetical protein
VHPITLYQETVKVEHMIKSGEKPEKVLEALTALADQYTRLDPRTCPQRIEGVHAVSAELIGLKQLFAAVKGPDQAVAEYRIHRLAVAFDSLAYPQSPAWLPMVRSIENHLDKIIDLTAKQDYKAAKAVLSKVRSERDNIWLALQLYGNPSELNLMLSVHKYVEGQLASENLADQQAVLDALGQYRAALGRLTADIQTLEEPPMLPVVTVTLGPKAYGTTAALLLVWFGWKMWRKKKN